MRARLGNRVGAIATGKLVGDEILWKVGGMVGSEGIYMSHAYVPGMDKWADYVIVGVRYNDAHSQIVAVKRRPDQGEKLGVEDRVGKKDIIDSIGVGHTYITAYWSDGSWSRGEDVRVIRVSGTDFIRTDHNHTKADNLGELPEF